MFEFDTTLNKSIKLLKSDNKKIKIAFLIIIGINCGLRISDLLKLKHLDFSGDTIQLIEQKTKKGEKLKLMKTFKMHIVSTGVKLVFSILMISYLFSRKNQFIQIDMLTDC